MKTVRQDAWTVEDDNVLADIILRHIRTGSTQLAAFQEAGQQLGRTQAACGYRWNGVVRKLFTAQIEIAKAERRSGKELQHRAPAQTALGELCEDGEKAEQGVVGWHEVLRFLRLQRIESQVHGSRIRQLERLTQENGTLRSECDRLEQELTVVREDYKALVAIMERARKMVFLGEQYQEERPKFKMDENGNLERIE